MDRVERHKKEREASAEGVVGRQNRVLVEKTSVRDVVFISPRWKKAPSHPSKSIAPASLAALPSFPSSPCQTNPRLVASIPPLDRSVGRQPVSNRLLLKIIHVRSCVPGTYPQEPCV